MLSRKPLAGGTASTRSFNPPWLLCLDYGFHPAWNVLELYSNQSDHCVGMGGSPERISSSSAAGVSDDRFQESKHYGKAGQRNCRKHPRMVHCRANVRCCDRARDNGHFKLLHISGCRPLTLCRIWWLDFYKNSPDGWELRTDK